MPFISIASNPGLLDSGIYRKVYDILSITPKESFIIYFGLAIIAFYLFRALYSVIHTYLINRYSMAINKHFSCRLFERILSIPYIVYVQKNSGEFISVINNEARQMSYLSLNIMQLVTELFTIILVYALMLVVNPKMTLVLTVILAVLVIFFLELLIIKNKSLGVKRVVSDRKTYHVLMEAFGNFKFVRLKGNKNELLASYSTAIDESLKSQVISNILGVVPKSILESLGFSLLIAAVIFILAKYKDASMVIPVISMYALALYRILPSIHRLLVNINNIAYVQHTLDKVNETIRQPVDSEGNGAVSFNESITLSNVSFKYVTGNPVINGISFKINKGEKIAITGESGGGKSTLADLIIGIYRPSSGKISIDGEELSELNIRSWRKKIGYIPQNIYLFDGTVAENVTIGSSPNDAKIKQVLQKANIWDYLESKDGIYTKVGEGGIQLSGGQQQRIGIARALYDDPEILVLDEATSALDTETEEKIMDEIYDASMSKTLIIIAHRLSTVERCERKIHIEDGKIVN